MKQTKDVSGAARLDLSELLARVENDRELLRDLLSIFIEEFPRHVLALREAVDKSDVQHVRLVSHTLKGMLSNLAIMKAASCAGQLEQFARDDKQSSLKEALAAFDSAVAGLLPEIETYLAEKP